MGNGRLLGGMERLFYQQNTVGSSNLTSILFFEGTLDLESIPVALARVQRAYPLLSAQIVADPFLRYEVGDGELSFQIIKRADAEHWRLCARQEVKRHHKERRIFVTFLIGPESGEIIVAADHTLADAKSLYAVCQVLIAGLNGKTTPLVPIGKAWEQRVTPGFRGFRGIWRTIMFVWKLLRRTPEQSLRFGRDTQNVNTVSYGFHFDRVTLARLKKVLDQNKSNLNSLFCAASMLAAFDVYSEEESGIACLNVPVSVREQIDPPASPVEMGMFISAFLQWHELSAKTDIWDLSRRILHTTRTGVQAGEAVILGKLAGAPKRPRPPKTDKARRRFEHSITVSNPGKLVSFEDLPNAKIVGYRNLGSLWTQESIVVVVLGYGENLFVDAEISLERLGHIPDAAQKLADGIRQRVLNLIEEPVAIPS